MNYQVRKIAPEQTADWLLHKHYAKRIPQISEAFGLYDQVVLRAVCTFGSPCRYYNNGEFVFYDYAVPTMELNRLCIEEGMEKNALSFFIGSIFKQLRKPLCLVSYADARKYHHGYIYQATNWLYTGLSEIHDAEYIINGKEVHSRTLTGKGITAPKEWARASNVERTKEGLKHRYFYFIGSKKEKTLMRARFRFAVLPYPKGDNIRYDASYQPITQDLLFT